MDASAPMAAKNDRARIAVSKAFFNTRWFLLCKLRTVTEGLDYLAIRAAAE
jgi:hypothetical protein